MAAAARRPGRRGAHGPAPRSSWSRSPPHRCTRGRRRDRAGGEPHHRHGAARRPAGDVVALDGVPIAPTWHRAYLLGADGNGRDVAVRLLYAVRNSPTIGARRRSSRRPGHCAGALAGYVGGRTDAVVMRGTGRPVVVPRDARRRRGRHDARAAGRAGASKLVTLLLIGVVSIPYVARRIRGRVLALRGRPTWRPRSCRARGPGGWWVRARPEPLVHAVAIFSVPVHERDRARGRAVVPRRGRAAPGSVAGHDDRRRAGRDFTAAPHLLLAPCAALALTALAVNLVGDAVRRALDPDAVVSGPQP